MNPFWLMFFEVGWFNHQPGLMVSDLFFLLSCSLEVFTSYHWMTMTLKSHHWCGDVCVLRSKHFVSKSYKLLEYTRLVCSKILLKLQNGKATFNQNAVVPWKFQCSKTNHMLAESYFDFQAPFISSSCPYISALLSVLSHRWRASLPGGRRTNTSSLQCRHNVRNEEPCALDRIPPKRLGVGYSGWQPEIRDQLTSWGW